MLGLNAILVQKNSFPLIYCLLLEGKITQLLRPNYETWTRTDGRH